MRPATSLGRQITLTVSARGIKTIDRRGIEVVVAELISLVPGTVVIEVVRNPRRLYLHVIDLIADDAVEQVQEMSVV